MSGVNSYVKNPRGGVNDGDFTNYVRVCRNNGWPKEKCGYFMAAYGDGDKIVGAQVKRARKAEKLLKQGKSWPQKTGSD